MFYGRMEYKPLAKPVAQKDRLNFTTSTLLEEVEDIRIYLIRNSYNQYQTNELNVREYEYTGYTTDTRPQVGWVVDRKYVIEDIRKTRDGLVLSLNSLGNSAQDMVIQQVEGEHLQWIGLNANGR